MEGQNNVIPKRLVLAAAISAVFGGIAAPAYADSYDVLLEKLRAKGVITDSEYGEFQTLREDDIKAAEKAGKEEAKLKYKDGFTLESPDGANSISIEGRMHADYRYYDNNNNSADGFDIRRAFLGVKGTIAKDWSFEVTGDLSADTLEYAYLNYKASDAAQIRIGAFKMPFSYEELTSSRFIDFQERSMGNALAPGKEQGLMVYGEPVKGKFAYAVAVSNGNGKEGDETNAAVDDKDIIARVATNLAGFLEIPDTVLHLGLGYSTGTIAASAANSGRTEARGISFFSASAFGTEVDRERLGLEALAAFGPFKLQSEWIQANFQNGTDAPEFDRNIDTYYVSAHWMLTGEKYSDSYTLNGSRAIKPNNPFKKGGDGWGAWELGVRYSKWDASDFTTTNAPGTGVLTADRSNEADAVTVGLKWIPVTPVRVYLNYTQTDFDQRFGPAATGTTDEKAVTLRTAVYF
jgi:phosphate-selective porin OprO and OprP